MALSAAETAEYCQLLELKLARESLLEFTLRTMPDFRESWHHRVIADRLTRLGSQKNQRLMVFAPPRHTKSELVSRRFPAWYLGNNPDAQMISTSYAGDVASAFNRDVQRIIDSASYREIFPWLTLAGTESARDVPGTYLRNNDVFELPGFKGRYRCAGVGGSITSHGADMLIIDDPLRNAEEAESPSQRNALWEWYKTTARTRLQPGGNIVLLLTRWHEDDLAGRLLKLQAEDPNAERWEVLVLPAIAGETLDPRDPRQPGEALWPTEFPVESLVGIRALGERMWAALYQQTPRSEGGNLIKSAWFRHWDRMPERFDSWLFSWDMSFLGNATSDWVVGQVWAKLGADHWLIDQARGRWDFPKTLEQVLLLRERYPQVQTMLIEEKANGPAIMSMLKAKLPGVIGFNPKTDKVARLNAVSPYFESGNVWLPPEARFTWVAGYKAELQDFPNGRNDDQVDATSQALLRMSGSVHDRLRRMLAKK